MIEKVEEKNEGEEGDGGDARASLKKRKTLGIKVMGEASKAV